MRFTPVAGLAAALALALAAPASAAPVTVLGDDGRVSVREDRFLPPAGLPAPPPAQRPRRAPVAGAAAKRKTVRGELARMLRAGAIDQATHDAHRRTYARALSTRRKLSGARRAQLGGVIENLEEVAERGRLTVSRLPALFETVARNRRWWATGPLLASGRRVSFEGSRLVWQYYPGEGLQIQWLGTFGKANGLFQSDKPAHDAALRALLDEAIGLAAQRAGGTAFEYLFDFGGGAPPWASALAQGTAIQALSRAAIRLQEPRYFETARSLLGIFRTRPPQGVRVQTGAGAHYLIYSYAPGLRVLNGFVQALNGLHDFALFANDAEGRALFADGDARLREEVGRYDSGAWSRYSEQRESDVGYHTLTRDFLRNLCKRLTEDLARPSGGPKPGADPAPYCQTAERFTRYLREDPVLELVSRRVRAGRPATVRLTLSKPSFVSLTLRRGGETVARLSGRLGSGGRSLRWARPRGPATYDVILRATDLAGNDGAARGELRVLARRK